MSRKTKPSAFFVGVQRAETFGFRLYNVVGDHPLSGSTVTVERLVQEHIPVPDLSKKEIDEECKALGAYMGKAES